MSAGKLRIKLAPVSLSALIAAISTDASSDGATMLGSNGIFPYAVVFQVEKETLSIWSMPPLSVGFI